MSTPPVVRRPAPAPGLTGENEIRIVSHSNLFYWWPVWAIGFIMAVATWVDGHLMAVVPQGTDAAIVPTDLERKAPRLLNRNQDTTLAGREVLVAPKQFQEEHPSFGQPRLHMARSKNPGVIFAVAILLVIAITNIQLRGLWSVVIIVLIIFLVIIFATLGWWEDILGTISLLDIRINLGGYLFISSVLFIIWLVTFLLFDPQMYMIFTPGQLRVRLEVGTGETAYDTRGMTIQKQRSDLFRHWILGLGSGDLIVNTSGATAHHFDLPNVLFVGRKVKAIEDMLRSVPVVRGE